MNVSIHSQKQPNCLLGPRGRQVLLATSLSKNVLGKPLHDHCANDLKKQLAPFSYSRL